LKNFQQQDIKPTILNTFLEISFIYSLRNNEITQFLF